MHIEMTEADGLPLATLSACSFDRWYPSLRQHSIPSTVLPLSDEFVEYLKADGVFVPGGDEGDDDDDWFDGKTAQDEGEETAAAPHFPALEAAIDSAIDKHGGAVLPKLNWSAPVDAAWMLGGSLKCHSVRDVLLLLKSSDRVAHDLCEARQLCTVGAGGDQQHSWVLVLRKWSNLRPSSEFRCFRSGGRLVAACQRDRFSHYPFLEPEREQILERLERFQREHLTATVLPEPLVWDAYVDVQGRVYLIDAAPFHESTDPILFDWPGLRARAAQPQPAELRLVEADTVRPSAGMYHGMPFDLQQQGCETLEGLVAKAASAAEGAPSAEGL
tara:strand:- start:1311 stop:2300 length:990 start_codon:yes stop_codon:yes gene_type:complete